MRRLIGCYAFLKRTLHLAACRVPAYYRTMLVVDPKYAALGYGELLVRRGKAHFLDAAVGPRMVYGFIEADNARSLVLSERVGYERLTTMRAALFSRLFPHDHAQVAALDSLSSADAENVASLLREQYAGQTVVDGALALRPHEYFVLRDGERVLAGLQIVQKQWRVLALPGALGAVGARALAHLPLVRRMLNPPAHRFLMVTNAYVRAGYEEALPTLLEAVLKRHGLFSALAILDTRSTIYRAIDETAGFGVLHQLGLSAPVQLMAGMNHISEEQRRLLFEQPFWISPFDRV